MIKVYQTLCLKQRNFTEATTKLHSITETKLNRLVQQRKLTESLQLLESVGFTGDTAIFILNNVQLNQAGGIA